MVIKNKKKQKKNKNSIGYFRNLIWKIDFTLIIFALTTSNHSRTMDLKLLLESDKKILIPKNIVKLSKLLQNTPLGATIMIRGISIDESTWNTFFQVANHLHTYMEYKKTLNIPLDDIDFANMYDQHVLFQLLTIICNNKPTIDITQYELHLKIAHTIGCEFMISFLNLNKKWSSVNTYYLPKNI